MITLQRSVESFARLAWVAALLCVAAPTFAAPVSVVDDRGVRVTLDRAPMRIVTLLPSLTESVCGLDACDRLVGVDRYSDWPASVARLPKVGGLDDTSVERVVALRPDVVLAGKSARVLERLEGLGVKVVVFDGRTHADVRRTLAILARLLGTPAASGRVWDAIERDLAAAASRVPPAVRGRRVYFEVAPTPYAAGASSFIGETLARLGMDNIVPAALGPFPLLNPEYVVRSAPDIVMASRRDLATMDDRPGWNRLVALRRGETCGFDARDDDVLLRPGPRLGEAALLLADCLARLPSADLPGRHPPAPRLPASPAGSPSAPPG